ncbi:MAG: hypothetical protein JSU01_14045 [Bacteroidetes bacterium]|nr:hypothetical protein [Bacteroidota bacterium]
MIAEIKLYKSKWKAIKLILMGLPLVLACVFLLSKNDSHRNMEWFGICFFGLTIPIGIFNLFDRQPRLIINEEGIYIRIIGFKDFINWDVIKDAIYKERTTQDQYSWIKQKFLSITFDPGDSADPKNVSIYLNSLQKIDGQKLADVVNQMAHSDTNARRQLLLTTEL